MNPGHRHGGELRLARIRIHPIKALPPLALTSVRISAGGALSGDRRWALLDREGKYMNGKRTPAVHLIAARYENGGDAVLVRDRGAPIQTERRFTLPDDAPALEAWLAERLGPLRLARDDARGFPDDAEAWGPTVVSTESLATVASWFPDLPPAEGPGPEPERRLEAVRLRFRSNLEVAGGAAFAEDAWFGAAGTEVRLRLGDVALRGSNPCQRCVVPTRDPETGLALADFQRRFRERREATLPAWAERGRFDHFYRLALNTRIAPSEAGKLLRVGDAAVLEP
jgi:hypothetical protein